MILDILYLLLLLLYGAMCWGLGYEHAEKKARRDRAFLFRWGYQKGKREEARRHGH